MCGFAGYVDFHGTIDRTPILLSMLDALGRRGPDDRKIYSDDICGLAHTRLSILDLAGSRQPMTSNGGDLTLAFNGEIYNYRELRSDLRSAGAIFSTLGDTEVLLEGLSRDWRRWLPRLDGMFALAAWDRRRRWLLLARDPLGEKPLFYAMPEPSVLVFGSEVKAVLQHPAVAQSLNLASLRQTLRFNAAYGRSTLYNHVLQLQPGEFLEFGPTGARIGAYYNLIEAVERERTAIAETNDADLVQRGRELFSRSVRRRLVADVPIGAFLSGGLDSSMTVAAMRAHWGPDARIPTFSVGFTGDPRNELPYAKLVADHCRAEFTPVTVGPECVEARLRELSSCNDAPIAQPGAVAVAEMSRIARRTVKVVLSGCGADEIFAGYPKYAFANAPRALSAALRMLGPRTIAVLAIALGSSRTNIAFRALSQRHEVERISEWFSSTGRGSLYALLPGLNWTDAVWSGTTAVHEDALSFMSGWGPLRRMQMIDCLTWLRENILESNDRMSMAEGLEMRPPFLDKELAAFALALPNRLKVRDGAGKWMVRQWSIGALPKTIRQRKKWGFRAPLAEWFRGPLREFAADYLTSSRGVCGQFGDPTRVSTLIDAHSSGRIDASATLWTLMSTEVWYQDVFRQSDSIPPASARTPLSALGE